MNLSISIVYLYGTLIPQLISAAELTINVNSLNVMKVYRYATTTTKEAAN